MVIEADSSIASVPESSSGWYSPAQLSKRNPAFTLPSVRYYVFNAKRFGLERFLN